MTQPTFIDAFTQPIEVNPSSTALIVVDMQNATGNRNMGLGKLLAESAKQSSDYSLTHRTITCAKYQKLLAAFGIMTGRSFTLLTAPKHPTRMMCLSI